MKVLISNSVGKKTTADQKLLWNYPKNKNYEGYLALLCADTKVDGKTIKKGVYLPDTLRAKCKWPAGRGLHAVITSNLFDVHVGVYCTIKKGKIKLADQYRSAELPEDFVKFLIDGKYLVTEDEFLG